MGFESGDKELDVSISRDAKGLYTARIIHRPTGAIKISNSLSTQEEAVDDALDGLSELVTQRLATK